MTTTRYPHTSKLIGRKIDDCDIVDAIDLVTEIEALLAKAPRVWGNVGEVSSSWHSEKPGTYIQEKYNHTALLIAIEPIEKAVTEDELREVLASGACGKKTGPLLERILKNGFQPKGTP